LSRCGERFTAALDPWPHLPIRLRERGDDEEACFHHAHSLNRGGAAVKASGQQEHPMLALGIIFGFVALLAAINFIEFGRID
jgi:hypothetical protein